MSGLKVGDKLAFRVDYPERFVIESISKITPTGRMTCGRWIVNPDLTIRGGSGLLSPHRAELITDQILDAVKRQNLLARLRKFEWGSLDTHTLETVSNLINTQKEKE